jgi:gelsolin
MTFYKELFIRIKFIFTNNMFKTVALKNKSFQWNIHFWLGADSSIDEYATAAIKAVELDTYLGSGPVQYREVKSQCFSSYF